MWCAGAIEGALSWRSHSPLLRKKWARDTGAKVRSSAPQLSTVTLRWSTTIPRSVGLAGSSALVVAALTLGLNLAVDLVYGLIDPRIRYA